MRLLDDGGVEIVLRTETLRLGDLRDAPLARAPVEHLALGDEVVHRAGRLEDRRRGIGAVAVVEVEVVDLQAAERVVAGLDDMFAGETGLVGLVVLPAEEDLARNEVAAAAPAGFLQDRAHHEFGLAVGVGLGVVEKINAGVVGGVEELFRDGVADLLAEGDPRAEGERADLQAGFAERTMGHAHAGSMNSGDGLSNDYFGRPA